MKTQTKPKRRLIRGVVGALIGIGIMCAAGTVPWYAYQLDFFESNATFNNMFLQISFIILGGIITLFSLYIAVSNSYRFTKNRVKKDILCKELTEEEHEYDVEMGMEPSDEELMYSQRDRET